MYYQKKILIAVYSLYIEGVDVETIGGYLELHEDDVDEMIDYINYIIL